MEAELIKQLTNVASDAVKILGPAIVAAYATYKATKAQYESNIEQVKHSNMFKARERLLEYYQSQMTKLSASANSLNGALGYVLGTIAGDENFAQDDTASFQAHMGIVNLYISTVEMDCKAILRDMGKCGLGEFEEYKRTDGYLKEGSGLVLSSNLDECKEVTLKLLEIYNHLSRCSQLVLEHQIESLFRSYISEHESS